MKAFLEKVVSTVRQKRIQIYDNMTSEAYDIIARSQIQTEANIVNWDELGEIDLFTKLLPTKGKILDVGCGMGRHSPCFRSSGFDYVGIDVSETSLAIARRSYLGAEFVHGSINKMSFPDESFDGFWALMSLQHQPKSLIVHSLSQLRRILKFWGFGYILISQGSGDGLWRAEDCPGAVANAAAYGAEEFVKKLNEAKLRVHDHEVVHLEVTGYSPAHRFIVKR